MSLLTRIFGMADLSERNNDQVRHILRRLTFGPTPEQLDRFDGYDPQDVIDELLDDAPLTVTVPDLSMFADDDADLPDLPLWWFRTMAKSEAGVHERMVWFWHGLITSSLDKASHPDIANQHLLLRRHAMGNFRELLKDITLDAAMLLWLDGSDSYVDAPNENYAREVMELFSLGRFSGVYTEDDVKAGAKALAGYWVEEEDVNDDYTSQVLRNEDDAFLDHQVEFLGTRVMTSDDVIDAICDHPQCARYIAGKVYESFFGFAPSESRLNELAENFAGADLYIDALVRDVVTDPELSNQVLARPKSPVEWSLSLERLVGMEIDSWVLEDLGQLPFYPPNVAGWPGTSRWVSAAAALSKSTVLMSYAWDADTIDSDDPVEEVIWRSGLESVSDSTRAALNDVASIDEGDQAQSFLLYATMAMSPEFSLI